MHTIAEEYIPISLIKPKSITATETGSAVTVEDYEDDAMVILNLGALGGTTETFVGKVQTSINGTDWVDAVTFASVTGSNGDNKIAASKLNLSGIKQIKGIITMDGTSASLVSMMALVKPRISGVVNSTTPA